MVVNVNVQAFFSFLNGIWSNHHLEVRLLDWIELLARELQVEHGLAWRASQRLLGADR